MIYYICRSRHAYTVGILLSYFGPILDDTVRIVPYERLELLTTDVGDVVIWTDLDRLDLSDVAIAASKHEQIAHEQPKTVQLNHPVKSLRRFDLLTHLYDGGSNRFRVFRFDDVSPDIAFPVFIRRERGPSRHAPALIDNWHDLKVAMAAASKSEQDKTDLMVVEYCAKPEPDGKYRKYGIFRIGDAVFPQDCVVNDHWFIKYASRRNSEVALQENRRYLETNPHADEALPIFKQANIEFGRMDYGVVDGRIQVFEINTNPTFVTQPPSRYDDFDRPARARMYQNVFIQLDEAARQRAGITSRPSRPVSSMIDEVHAEVLVAVRERADRRHRRRQVKGFLASVGRGIRRVVKGRLGRPGSPD